jgi:hypothetical protein
MDGWLFNFSLGLEAIPSLKQRRIDIVHLIKIKI